jgi:VanZ family protein
MSSKWKQLRYRPPLERQSELLQASNPRPSSHANTWRLAGLRLSSGWIVLLYCFALLTESHWPVRPTVAITLPIMIATFAAHIIMVAPLTPMLASFLSRLPTPSLARFQPVSRDWLAVAIVVVGRSVDELTRPWFGRSPSVEGCLGDAAGVLVGVGILFSFRAIRRSATPATR